MLTSQDFIRMFKIIHQLIKSQTAGLTQADSLIQPRPSGNCLNWVLGHILDSQALLLAELGGTSPVDRAGLAVYTRESQPITADSPEVWQLERLLESLDSVHAALVDRLGEMSAVDFERQVLVGERSHPLGWRLFFLHFHLTYHTGQLELLRQLAGHTEKII